MVALGPGSLLLLLLLLGVLLPARPVGVGAGRGVVAQVAVARALHLIEWQRRAAGSWRWQLRGGHDLCCVGCQLPRMRCRQGKLLQPILAGAA